MILFWEKEFLSYFHPHCWFILWTLRVYHTIITMLLNTFAINKSLTWPASKDIYQIRSVSNLPSIHTILTLEFPECVLLVIWNQVTLNVENAILIVGRRTRADYQKPLFQKVSYYRHQMSFPRRTALSAFTDILVFYCLQNSSPREKLSSISATDPDDNQSFLSVVIEAGWPGSLKSLKSRRYIWCPKTRANGEWNILAVSRKQCVKSTTVQLVKMMSVRLPRKTTKTRTTCNYPSNWT